VTDLISGASVSVRRETGELVGATESQFDDLETVFAILREGHARKKFAATAMNDRSSRSHTAFIIQVSNKIN
jgi:hypothetical protein